MFFQLLLAIKVTPVDKMDKVDKVDKVVIYVLFYLLSRKNCQFSRFSPDF